MKKILSIFSLVLCISSSAQTYYITTVAGNGGQGSAGDGGAATSANLNYPTGVSVDASGNLFISDKDNSRVRKVNSSGIISTYAGTGVSGFSGDGGAATAAMIYRPYGNAT